MIISRGSLFQVLSASTIAQQLGFFSDLQLEQIRQDAGKLNAKLMALIKSLNVTI